MPAPSIAHYGTTIIEAMPPEGKLIAFDVSEEYTAIAREAWQRAGFTNRQGYRGSGRSLCQG